MDLRNAGKAARSKSFPFLCRRISSVSLFIILNLLFSPAFSFDGPYSLKTNDGCIKMSNESNCQCVFLFGDTFYIRCPKLASHSDYVKLEITLYPAFPDTVLIQCFSMNVDYGVIPEMTIGNLKKVEMLNCRLTDKTPLASILQKFDFIESKNSDDFGINLIHNNLNELESLEVTVLAETEPPILNLTRNTFKDLKNLRSLTLDLKGIELPTGLFGPLENLRILYFVFYNIQFLPTGIFRNLSKLEKLYLRFNGLRYINKTNFEGLTNLTTLNLASNDIETLKSNIFELVPNLVNIDLSLNRFVQLPSGLLANTKNLNQFVLEGNKNVSLVSLPESFFSNLTKLEEISISCGLQSVHKDLFANSLNIVTILLENNELTTLPKTVLSDQIKLETLNLNNNKLMDLPDKLFQNNKRLKVLNLSNNQLRNISRSLFSTLQALKELYLANNRLSIIDSDVFVRNWNLETLHLQNNSIKFSESVNQPFSNLYYLQDLNLHNNSITTLLIGWKYLLHGLRTLDLSYNKINQFDSRVLGFSSTNHLIVNITHNEIKRIDFSNVSSTSLRNSDSPLTLDINDNPLNCDCMLLEFVQFLYGSYPDVSANIKLLTKNLICNTPDNLRGRTVSTLLGMELLCPWEQEDPKGLFCPDNCKCWERTIDHTLMVNCSNGNWSKIPKLPDMRDKGLIATELNMTNNSLMELPLGNQSGYAQVTKLILFGNNLTHLDVTRLPRGLTHLDLRYNHIQFLNESIITFLNESHKFVSLQLSNNPWLCNCNMKPLLTYKQNNYKRITDLSLIQCAAPFKGKNFQELFPTDICLEDESSAIFLAIVISVIALFGFLIGIIVALYYKYKIEIKIWLYAHNMCLRFVTEEDLDKDKQYDAFVSYSSLDEEFILQQLIPKLEQNTPKFRLCIHSRDWPVGDSIPNQIANSVENSRRTIILLSKNFLESVWAPLEFRVAHRSALTEKRTRLIVILFGDIGDKEKLDAELRAYINSNTYLEYGDPKFWEKLRYAMPHQFPKINRLKRNQLRNVIADSNLEIRQ